MGYKINLVSIVVPVFNEEKYIVPTLEKVLAADTLGTPKEVIVINDGSTDDTRENLLKFAETHKDIVVINKPVNQGKGFALKEGFMASKGDVVIIQDADLEYSPTDYPVLLEPFVKMQADVVYGSRFISAGAHRILYFWHSVGNNFLTLLSNILTNLNLTDMETGFKVFRGDLIREIAPKLKCERFGFEPEITARIAYIPEIKIYEVGVSYWGRTYAQGKKIGWKDGFKAIWEIIYFNVVR